MDEDIKKLMENILKTLESMDSSLKEIHTILYEKVYN